MHINLNYFQKFNFKDPAGIEHYYFVVKVSELREGIPFAVNPRLPDITKPTYKDVQKSLESNDGKFLQKNMGITLLARSVNIDDKRNIATVNFDEFDGSGKEDEKGQSLYGITNGGHTYHIILNTLNSEESNEIDKQFINIRIMTGIQGTEEVVSLAHALNASVHVDKASLANLNKGFEWLKTALGSTISKDIRWFQNDGGIIDVDYLISLMICMHPDKFMFGSKDSDEHPHKVYASKAAARKEYDQKKEEPQDPKGTKKLTRLENMVKDILELRDYIQLKAFEMASSSAKKSNSKIFLKPKLKKEDQFISPAHKADEVPEMVLCKPALFMIVASYRCLVKRTTDKYSWNVKGGIKGVKEFYVDYLLGDQIECIRTDIARDHPGASPTQWGKAPYIWSRVYRLAEQRFKK